jgi:hypothetical protein
MTDADHAETYEQRVQAIQLANQPLLYVYSLRRLDEATEGNVYDFLEDWFPRKALWASVTSMKVYLASFKKFFKWMGATGLVSPEIVEDVLSTLKDDRHFFLRKVAEEFLTEE